LRFYFATLLSAAPTDVDLDLKAFEERVNSHLVGKWVNIASRTAKFVQENFGGKLAAKFSDEKFNAYYQKSLERMRQISVDFHSRLYERGDFSQITRDFVNEADFINGIIAEEQPWKLAKDPTQSARLHDVCTLAINYFRLLAIYLKPIVPETVARAEKFLGEKFDRFDQAETLLLERSISPFEALATRIDAKQIDAMIEASKESLQPTGATANGAPSPQPSPASGRGGKKGETSKPGDAALAPRPSSVAPAPISIDDFAKLDLRIGTVLSCGFVDGSDKLLRFELDAGELGKRQIFSGIRAAYQEPEKLVGRKVVFIANLEPRKMRFGVSEGMILSAGSGGGELFLLDVDSGAQAGMPVK
jgi:methionyl-tRNA synthetase